MKSLGVLLMFLSIDLETDQHELGLSLWHLFDPLISLLRSTLKMDFEIIVYII
jgi:hypothetical protein